jgi:hypothetical protein
MAAAPPTTGGKDAYNKINEKDKPVGITRGGEQSCFAIALFQLLVRSNSFLTVFYNIDIDSLNEEQEKIYNSLKNVIDAYASSEINGDEYTPVGTLAEKGEEGKACILKNTEGKIETDDSSSQYNYILTKLKITPDPLSLECLDNLGTQPKLLDIGCTYDKEEFLVHVNDSHSTDKNKKLASDVKKILPIYEMFGYTLKGFTVHIGFHYIAYINHKNTWWLCNDAEKITEQDSLNTILDEIGDKTNKSITLLLLTKTKGENFTDIKENLKAIYTDGTVNDVIDDTQKKNKGYIIEYIKQVQKVDKLLNIKKDIEQVGYTNLGFAKPSISDIIADVSTQLKNYFTLATELKIDSTKDLYKIKMIKIPARFDIKEPTDDKDKRPFYRDAAVCNEYIQKLNITIIPDKIKPYLNNSVDNLYQLLQASKTYLADNKNSNNLIEALKKYTELLSDISMTYAGKDKITYKDIEVLNLTEAQKNKYDTLLSASRAAALTGSNKSKNESWDSDIHINLDSIIQNYTDYNDTKQILTLLKVLIKEDSFLSTNPPNASPPPATLIEIEFGNEYEVLLSLLADVDNSTRSITKINEIFNPMQDGTNKYYLNIVDVLNKIMSKLTLSRADLKVNEDTINGILTLLISLYPPKDKGTLEGRENDVDLLFDIDTFKKTYLTKILENLDKLPMYPETKDRDKLKFLDLAISRFDIQLPDNPRIVDIIQSLLRKISKVTDNNATKLKNFTKIITNFSILRKDIDNKSLKDKDTQEKIKAAKFFEKTFEIILENETPILNKNNLIVNTDFPKEWTKSGSDVFISYNNFIYLETIMNQNNNEFTESLNKYKTKTGDGSLPLSSSLHIGGTPPMEGAQQAAVVAGPAPSQVELRLAKIKEDIKNSEKLRKKINEIQDNIKGVQQIWDTYKQNVTIKNFKDLSAVSILDYLVGEMNKDISNETTLTSFATDTSFMYSNIFKSVIYSGDLKNPPSYSLKPYNSKANTWRVYNTAIPQQSAWTGAKFSEYDTKLDQLDKEREKFVRNLNSLKNIFINNNDLSSNLYMEQFKLLVNILTIFKSKDKSILTAADISTATIPDNIISTILDEKLSYREEISKKLDAIKGQNKGYALRNISEQVKSAISGKNLCVFLKEVDGTDTGGSVIKYYYLNLEEIKKEIQSYKEVYDNTPGYTASDIFGTNEYLQKDAPRLKETLKTKIDEIKKGTNEVLTKLTAYGEEYGPSNPAIKSKVLEVLKPLDVSKEPFTIEEKLNQLVRVMSADIEYYTNEFGKQKTGIEKAQQLQSAQGLQRGGVDGEEATNSIKQQRAELDKLFKPYKKNPSDTESVDETIYKEINNLREVNNSFLTNIKKAADPTISLSLQGTDSIFNSLFNKYNQSKQDTSKGEYVASQELAEGLKTNELLPRDVLKIDFRDKVIFIFASLFLRLIALAIIEYVIDKGKISNLKWAVLSFLGIFTGLFYLLVLVVNLDSYKLRIVFNYVNFHANSSIAIVYPAMLWLFGLAIYYIMWNINGGDGVTAANDEDRLRLKYRIQVLSMITWLFLSLMVLLF